MAQSGEREVRPHCAPGERVNTDCTVVSVMSISPHADVLFFSCNSLPSHSLP